MKKPLILAAALLLAAAPGADAAGWKQLTASGGANIDQVSPVRTADGALHVAWKKGGDVFHTTLGPDGRIRQTTPIATGWASTSDPALTVVPGGLRAFWGGIRTTESTETNQDQNTAFSSDGGATWTLQTGSTIPIGAQAYASDTSATTLPNGTTLATWFGTNGTWVHAGLDPAVPNVNYQGAGYGNDSNLASDASGAAMLAWFSDNPPGVLAQPVGAGGAPAGPALRMPGTQVMVGGPELSRTPIVARPSSGGFYIARGVGYPSSDKVRVWRVGSGSTTLLASTRSSAETAIASDAKGRLWVAWTDGEFGDEHVYYARSNPAATRFGAAVDAGAVKNAHSTYTLDVSAAGTAADLLAVFGVNDESSAATYALRVLPGLTLAAQRSRSKVLFTVTDAGEPVKGATVKAGGRSGRTDAKGRVVLTLKSKSASRATASGYVPATLKAR